MDLKKSKQKDLINYLFIIIGSLIMAVGIVAFLAPNKIATGGTAGLAILINALTNLPIGLSMILINIPLIILGIKYLGKSFALKTIVCLFSLAFFTDLFKNYIQIPAFTDEFLLATLYGGIAVGIGLGFIFRGGASAGGATIIAQIISQKKAFKASNTILILDTFIIILTAITFKSIELALWSLISIFTTSKLIDFMLTGGNNQKIIHISSVKNLSDLSTIISEQMGISGTIIKGNSLGETEYKDIIFILIDKSKLMTLKSLVKSYDNQAKMIVMDANEVL
jgi:uncharacterized membrane-anchored protein YitT (DUF2179 family)